MARKKKIELPAVVSNEIKLLRYQNADDLSVELSNLFSMSLGEVAKIVADDKQSSLKVMLARAIIKAINKQDEKLMTFLLNRHVGPVKERLDVNLSGKVNIHKYAVDYIQTLEHARKIDPNDD